MRLSSEAAARVQSECEQVLPRLTTLGAHLVTNLLPALKSDKAREYLSQGLCRRLGLVRRCIENVFAIFPPDRQTLLSRNELSDVQINLHAFVVNVYGSLDNLAWVYVAEKGLDKEVHQKEIGLFNKKTQRHLPAELCEYLNTKIIEKWFNEYAKNFRDALAHRIPLYVPPASFTPADQARWEELEAQLWEAILGHEFDEVERLEQEKGSIGTVYAAFLHSLSDAESRPVQLHAQLLCDALTVVEVAEKVTKHLPLRSPAA